MLTGKLVTLLPSTLFGHHHFTASEVHSPCTEQHPPDHSLLESCLTLCAHILTVTSCIKRTRQDEVLAQGEPEDHSTQFLCTCKTTSTAASPVLYAKQSSACAELWTLLPPLSIWYGTQSNIAHVQKKMSPQHAMTWNGKPTCSWIGGVNITNANP